MAPALLRMTPSVYCGSSQRIFINEFRCGFEALTLGVEWGGLCKQDSYWQLTLPNSCACGAKRQRSGVWLKSPGQIKFDSHPLRFDHESWVQGPQAKHSMFQLFPLHGFLASALWRAPTSGWLSRFSTVTGSC